MRAIVVAAGRTFAMTIAIRGLVGSIVVRVLGTPAKARQLVPARGTRKRCLTNRCRLDVERLLVTATAEKTLLIKFGRRRTTVKARTVTAVSVTISTTWSEETKGSGVVHGAVELGLIVTKGKGTLVANLHAVGNVIAVNGEEEFGTVVIGLFHDGAVAELGDQAILTLDRGVRDIDKLFRMMSAPWAANAGLKERNDEVGSRKVDKGVTDIVAGAEVDAKVAESVAAKAMTVEPSLEFRGSESVWDVADHDRGADISARLDAPDADRLVVLATSSGMHRPCWHSVDGRRGSREAGMNRGAWVLRTETDAVRHETLLRTETDAVRHETLWSACMALDRRMRVSDRLGVGRVTDGEQHIRLEKASVRYFDGC